MSNLGTRVDHQWEGEGWYCNRRVACTLRTKSYLMIFCTSAFHCSPLYAKKDLPSQVIKSVAKGNDWVFIERQFATGAGGRHRVLLKVSHGGVSGRIILVGTLLDPKLAFVLGPTDWTRPCKEKREWERERKREGEESSLDIKSTALMKSTSLCNRQVWARILFRQVSNLWMSLRNATQDSGFSGQ